MNYRSIWAIFKFEMKRFFRTSRQSIASPIISTVLYFIVFGSAIGTHIKDIDGVNYGAFIVPGLVMLTILGQSVANAAFGIYFPRFAGTIYEVLSAPISSFEIAIGYVGAAATKSLIIAIIVLLTAGIFVPIKIMHPLWMIFFLMATCITFSILGFIIGIWADGFDQLQLLPLLVITPLTFLGGSFYSIKMLPTFWYKISLFNPVVYLISGFRWSFYESADVKLSISIMVILMFIAIFIAIVSWIFKTGYRIRN